ncbi:SCL-interrupting locus protein homolog [Scyliorhinus canicula]|uniref:SCL-interrupting locus protein homolog n=1 Tax=Scyliorhinus canicula TaxID=7830 RepID=UPI0018F4A93F|nr:SCL-interrupting locus protein homolog [Scyliorhinus canicula]
MPFSFPKTKLALWDPTPLGDATSMQLAYYRNPKLFVAEKTLRLVHRHAKQSENKNFFCFLLGSFAVDDDEEGVTLTVDRLDPGREVAGRSDKIPTALLPGDFLIPCIIDTQGLVSRDTNVHTSEDFNVAFKMLYHYCCSKETIDSSRLLVMRGRINCIENLDHLTLELQWAAVTVGITFEATPINAIPIIPTALARNLSSPLNIAQVQGTYKFGYLTMDQTRKLLLILESDPKVLTLPLVGMWLSGATHVHSPQVWACCLRYLFSSSIQERVFSTEQKSFLLVLYSLTHRQPEFYECRPCSEHQKLDFQLLTSTEVLNICTSTESSSKQPIEFELSDENKNQESEFFKEVASNLVRTSLRCELASNKIPIGDNDSGVEEEDLSPRPTPSPHPVGQKFPRIYPSVPELSLVFDGSFIESKFTATRPQQNKPQQTTKTCGESGIFNSIKESSENGQQRVTSQVILPPSKQNLTLSHGSAASVKAWKERPAKQHQKGGHFVRKSSGSSSSSCSTPPSGPSPDTSIDQPKLVMSTDTADSIKKTGLSKGGVSPRGWQSMSNVRQSQGTSPNKCIQQSLQHTPNVTSPSPEMQLLGFPPYFHTPYPTSYCNCCQHHGPCCGPSINANWQGNIPTYGSKGVHSPNCHDCSPVPCQQTPTYLPNSHCSTLCMNNSPINKGLPGPVGSTSPPNSSLMKSSGGSHISLPNQCKMCTVPSACLHFPMGRLDHDREGNGTMGLPVDAYKILVEQDRQLKLLQAQIQRLLSTQQCGVTTPVTHCSSKSIGISNASPQPETKVGFVAMETPTSPGIHMKKSVSIAVSTGASLFWCPPEGQEAHQSVPNLKLNDSELSNEEMALSLKTEDTSHTSIASSLNEVDIHSFVENSQGTTESSDQAADEQNCSPECAKNCWDLHITFQSPVLGESASTYLQSSLLDVPHHIDNKETERNDGNITESHNNSPFQDEQRFYQNLMGQVNQLLESSPAKQNQGTENKDAESEASVQLTDNRNKRSEHQTRQKEDNDVLSATLRQLKKMGVKIDLESSSMTKTKSKIENASTLARINPEAVIPRLNYMSFVNVGTSGLGAGGADLSMEANAIALKYLNDAQLSQMSLRHGGNCESTSLSSLLELSADRSMVGLSLISPNNMSFATRKYMRRYGLVEDVHSSDEEDDLSGTIIQPIKSDSERLSVGKERSEKMVEVQIKNHCTLESFSKSDGNILKNITNEVASSKPQSKDTRAQDCQQIQNNPKPKINMFAEEICCAKHPEKENGIERAEDFSKKLRPNASEKQKFTKSRDVVGNILDVNRLRQLPKLF